LCDFGGLSTTIKERGTQAINGLFQESSRYDQEINYRDVVAFATGARVSGICESMRGGTS